MAQQRLPPRPGRPWCLPLPVRVLVVLVHRRANPTTRALAALFGTSQSTVDRIVHHLVPVLADALRPDTTAHSGPWIIDGTLIQVHDHTITAVSKNYRRSSNTQIIISAHTRGVVTVGHRWPGNRNDASLPVQLLTGGRQLLGDGGYRGITTITTPGRDMTGCTIRDHRYRPHRRIRARVEHVIARLKDWQILRQCRRRGRAINHSFRHRGRTMEPQEPQIITG
jgi:hypothetical protein